MKRPLGIWMLLFLALSGCHRHLPVGQAHVNEPGAYVISSHGATSIAWSDGRTSRVCTLPSGLAGGRYAGSYGGKRGVPHGHAMRAHVRGGTLDAFLFRLCEARGNGDITAEQYRAAVSELQQIMKQAHTKAVPMGPEGRGPWRPPGHRKRGPGPAQPAPAPQGSGD